jgi:hypothetical protein
MSDRFQFYHCAEDDDAPAGRNDHAVLRMRNRIENGWTAENYEDEEKETLKEVRDEI